MNKPAKDYSINGVKPINNDELTTYNATSSNGKDVNEKKRSHLFQPGNQAAKGNRKPRTKLSDRFIQDVLAEWTISGPAVLETMARTKPAAFANLVPKDYQISVDHSDNGGYVINAMPRNLTEQQWRKIHNLPQRIESKGNSDDTGAKG